MGPEFVRDFGLVDYCTMLLQRWAIENVALIEIKNTKIEINFLKHCF